MKKMVLKQITRNAGNNVITIILLKAIYAKENSIIRF